MIKKLFFIGFTILSTYSFSQVGVNTNKPNANTSLHISERSDPASTGAPNIYSGTIIQRYTTAERDTNFKNLSQAENGLSIYNTTSHCYNIWSWDSSFSTGSWTALCGDQVGLVRFTDCSTIKVVGAYDVDKPFNQQNVHIDIPVFVVKLGSFSYTAIINGITFSAEGNYVNKGSQTVTLTPSSGTTSSVGTYSGNVTIAPTEAQPTTGTLCSVSVTFKSRKTSVMKIVNVSGDLNTTSLMTGTNYGASTSYAPIGAWLGGGTYTGANSAVSYAGTQSINMVNVPFSGSSVNLRNLQLALEGASIVWLGASQGYSNGAAQLIKEWYQAGNGVVMITADKEAESIVADALGYYVGDGDSQLGQVIPGSLPEVFGTGAPFNVYTMQIGYSGANAGYISSNRGSTFMNTANGGHPTAYADLAGGGVFIFGDKFGSASTTAQKDNYAKVLVDIFAWSLKNAPVH